MSRTLTMEDHAELDEWLKGKGIVLSHRTRRDLSDVTNMAVLFKNLDKKLVNMRNYTSHNSVAAKLNNWETFSFKVLRKTGLILMRPALEQLASGELNALRFVLYHLMRMEHERKLLSSGQGSQGSKSHRDDVSHSLSFSQDARGSETINSPPLALITQPTNAGGDSKAEAHHVTPTPSKTDIEPNQDNDQEEEYISVLKQEVQYLKGVIEEKEKRINSLLNHLAKLSVRIITMQKSVTDEGLPLQQRTVQPKE